MLGADAGKMFRAGGAGAVAASFRALEVSERRARRSKVVLRRSDRRRGRYRTPHGVDVERRRRCLMARSDGNERDDEESHHQLTGAAGAASVTSISRPFFATYDADM